MSLICAISGNVPDAPVVSPVSGAVFERRLIELHLSSSDKDPINGQPLSVDQLVELKVPKFIRPRPPNATSVPALLKLLQDEMDATVLETFHQRQHVDKVRQELAHALYQHDAACRVIARLTKERDQARQALATLQPGAAAATNASEATDGAAAMEVEAGQGLPSDIAARIKKRAEELSKGRRKRAKPAELATPEAIQAFTQKSSIPGLHAANAINALSLHPSNDALLITGGSDKRAVVFNRSEEKEVAVLKGHTKKVTGVRLHGSSEVALTSSQDGTLKVWDIAKAEASHTIQVATHGKGVCGLSLHPTGDLVLSAGDDGCWALSDLQTGKVVVSVPSESSQAYTCVQTHPDGLIMAAGTHDGMVRVFDIKEKKEVHVFKGYTGAISAVAFSENGYYFATAGGDSTVKLWDLRSVNNNVHNITLESGSIHDLDFDHSGAYLAVAGSVLSVYGTKQWDLVKTFGDSAGHVAAAKFGSLARSVVTAWSDRTVRVFA